MSDPVGYFCLVLHGHLPYVLHHGSHPHGEAWLYEAAAETYLPLLDVIGEVALLGARPALTLGLTPVLLEQLAHPRFREGFPEYLAERKARARADAAEFEASGRPHQAYLACRWSEWYERHAEHFERLGRDLPGAFAARRAEGHIELLTSNATHAYMPLLLNDVMLHAQMRAGLATSERLLGCRPRGMWLPECAYRPHWEHWLPSVLYDNARDRPGLEQCLAAAGIHHFFVDTHLIARGAPLGTLDHGDFMPAAGDDYGWDTRRGWRQPLSAVGVASEPEEPHVFALARHPRVSEQVWSGSLGYPGAGAYLEFHRRDGERGLRYHKITDNRTALSEKQPYYPDDVPAKLFEHVQHFCDVLRETLRAYRAQTGRPGLLVAAFDAELFGHWWFEGPRFVRDVLLTLQHDPEVHVATTEEALQRVPPDKVMRLPEGSWGENGDHSVWMNDRVRWIWEAEYRAEGEFLKLLHALPWRTDAPVREALQRAGRELLLLQASDWPFVIHTGGAVDYGTFRFSGHVTAFHRALRIAEHLAGGRPLTPLQQVELADMDAHDSIFPEIRLEWWL